jgi:hypothetical protein
VDVDEEPVETWLPRALDTPVAGAATVVFHSVVWQYLPKETRDIVRRTLDDAGRRAAPDAPLAWVRLEPSLRMLHSELRYTLWPGGAETLLATAGFHAGPISWLG